MFLHSSYYPINSPISCIITHINAISHSSQAVPRPPLRHVLRRRRLVPPPEDAKASVGESRGAQRAAVALNFGEAHSSRLAWENEANGAMIPMNWIIIMV